MIRLRILGPVEADRDGVPVPLGGRQQRAVLAILLLNTNRVVPIPEIVDGVWPDRPPERAVNTVQVYVSALRRALGPHAGGEPLISTHGRGYRLRVDEDSFDLLAFLAAAAAGHRLMEGRRYATASERLQGALGLWRGPALSEFVDEPFAQIELVALEESRLAALEARIEADLLLGRHADVLPELPPLVAAHPLRERLRGLQIEALYRAGRQADALAAYQDVRRTLADELGIDPGPPLQALHRTVLAQGELRGVDGGADRPFLLLHDGAGEQRRVPLDPVRSPVGVGRRGDNDVCLAWDPEVSRAHARLEHTRDGWTLVDDGLSRNGSFVDGERVHGRRPLSDAQVLRFGRTVIVYRVTGAPGSPVEATSGVTRDASIRSASQLEPPERAVLEALARGEPVTADAAADLTLLHHRFGVADLPAGARDAELLRRARAIGVLPRHPG